MPEYITTIKVKDPQKVRRLFPDTWQKYIVKVNSYETRPLVPSMAKEIADILKALKIEHELIEVPITLESSVVIAGRECDISQDRILIRTIFGKVEHKKRVEKVTRELAKHDLLEDVQCKVRIITEKIC